LFPLDSYESGTITLCDDKTQGDKARLNEPEIAGFWRAIVILTGDANFAIFNGYKNKLRNSFLLF
jgi:hypothetical protein